MDSRTGSLSRSHTNRNKHKSAVSTVQYRTFSLLARGAVLLAFTRDGNLSFFRSDWKKVPFFFWVWLYGPIFEALIIELFCWHCSVALEVQGYLTIRCSLQLSARLHSIRASFCPLLSLEKGEYIGLYIKSQISFSNHECFTFEGPVSMWFFLEFHFSMHALTS